MIRLLLFKYHTLKALLAWNRDDWDECLTRLNVAEALHPLQPFQAAFKAQALIGLRQQALANELLDNTLQKIGQPRNKNERYIQIFCLLWQEAHFRDLPNANALWAEAMSLDCSGYLRRFLLVRQPPEFRLS